MGTSGDLGEVDVADDAATGRPVRRSRAALAVLAVLAVGVAAGVGVVRLLDGGRLPAPFGERSRCTVADTPYSFTTDQAANAATIAAVGLDRALPPRAVTIALATSMQESKLANLDHGDRDSLGLFQQRPSQGWGSPEQLRDPLYAAAMFYDALVRVPDWQRRPLTEVAQAVQRSGFPDAYAKWEQRARALALALVGAAPAALSCEFPAREARARQVAAVVAAFTAEVPGGRQVAVSGQPGGPAAAVAVVPATWPSAAWLVAHAQRLGVESVSFGGHTWTREHGWAADAAAPADQVLATPHG